MFKSYLWKYRLRKLLQQFRPANFPLTSALIMTGEKNLPNENFLRKLASITGIDRSKMEIIYVGQEVHPQFFDLQTKQLDLWGNIKDANIRKLIQRPGLLFLDLMKHDNLFKELASAQVTQAFRVGIEQRPDLFDLIILQEKFSDNEFLNEFKNCWHSLV